MSTFSGFTRQAYESILVEYCYDVIFIESSKLVSLFGFTTIFFIESLGIINSGIFILKRSR